VPPPPPAMLKFAPPALHRRSRKCSEAGFSAGSYERKAARANSCGLVSTGMRLALKIYGSEVLPSPSSTPRELLIEPTHCPRRASSRFQARFRGATGAQDLRRVFARRMGPFESQGDPCAPGSGEGVWMPLGRSRFLASVTKTTPAIQHPDKSFSIPVASAKTEILPGLWRRAILPARWASSLGNHFITLTSRPWRIWRRSGKTVLWKGAQKIRFEEV